MLVESNAGKYIKRSAKLLLFLGLIVCIAGIIYNIIDYNQRYSIIYNSGYAARITYTEGLQLVLSLKRQLISNINLYVFIGLLIPPVSALLYLLGVTTDQSIEKQKNDNNENVLKP